MIKKINIGLIAAFVIIMLAVIFLAQDSQHTQSLTDIFSDTQKSSSTQKNITIRNVTDEVIHYRIMPYDDSEKATEKILPIAAVHRYDSDINLTIFFKQGKKEVWRLLSPGKPYSFRYDNDDLVELWPGSHGRSDAEDLAPFVITPMPVVEKMLELAQVSENDILYDIGCGDGRIVITAAVTYGARGVGIDIDLEKVKESKNNAKRAGVSKLVEFLMGDATKMDISEATVVTLYLLPESNALLEPKLEQELKKGTRVVSHNYSMPGWKDRELSFIEMKDEAGEEHSIYVYLK
jgi:2-polyprenyl-3-methyl-5-hydroxy-6-metoxy-1,4-benzoquinol methylase